MRSSVSLGSTVPGSFLHLKNVDRALTPSRIICSSVVSFHICAMRENVRSAGPDRLLRSIAAPDRVWVVIVLSHFGAKRTYAPHVDFTQDGRRHIVACRQWLIATIITATCVPEIDTGISGPPDAQDFRYSKTRPNMSVRPTPLPPPLPH